MTLADLARLVAVEADFDSQWPDPVGDERWDVRRRWSTLRPRSAGVVSSSDYELGAA